LEKPLVSIIIVNYNGERFLTECLSSVFRADYKNFEVIVVDNGSSDKSHAILEKFAKENTNIKLIKNGKNLGFGPANNVGFKYAKGEYIVFLNNDTSVESQWLSPVVDVMEYDKTIGLAQSLILNMDGKTIQTAGFAECNYLAYKYSIGRFGDVSKSTFPEVFEISYPLGAAMTARRTLLDKIGLFDPKYFWYYDDEFLSFKTWLSGARVVTISGSKVRHFGSGTMKNYHNTVTQVRFLTISDLSIIFDANGNLIDLLKGFIITVSRLMVDSVFGHIDGRKEKMIGRTSGFIWFLKNFKYAFGNRLRYWCNAKVTEKVLLKKMYKLDIPTFSLIIPKKSENYFLREVQKYDKRNGILTKQ